jgi:hypothetical protein
MRLSRLRFAPVSYSIFWRNMTSRWCNSAFGSRSGSIQKRRWGKTHCQRYGPISLVITFPAKLRQEGRFRKSLGAPAPASGAHQKMQWESTKHTVRSVDDRCSGRAAEHSRTAHDKIMASQSRRLLLRFGSGCASTSRSCLAEPASMPARAIASRSGIAGSTTSRTNSIECSNPFKPRWRFLTLARRWRRDLRLASHVDFVEVGVGTKGG